MKHLWGEEGYTITEVMIVLAVSGAILASAMTMINGQQGRSEFQTGVRDFQTQMQDLINDVETGYFPNSGTPGTNSNSIFLGKAIHFHLDSNNRIAEIREMSIGGSAVNGTEDVTQISQAAPFAIPGSTANKKLYNGVELTDIIYGDGTRSKGFAVISGIDAAVSNGAVTRSTGSKGRFAYIAMNSANSEPNLSSRINSLSTAADMFTRPSRGVVFCLRGPSGTNRIAAVSYGILPGGGSNGQTGASETYFDGVAENLGCTL